MPRNQKQRQNKRQGGQRPRQGQKNQSKEQPNALTAPPTPQSVRKESRAATQTKFRPLERAIGAEVRASKQRVRQEGNWWQNYLDEVSGAQADTKAAYDQAAATSQGLITQAGATDAAQTAALQAEAAKNAELRGAAPGTELAGREAAAGAQRNYLTAATGAKVAQEGAAQQGYLRDKRRIGVGQSIASRKEEQRRTRGFEKDRRDTRGERGAYRVATEGEKQKDARDYLIQLRAFPEKKAELAQQARENAADRAIAKQNANSSRISALASRRNAATTAKGAGKEGGLTPAEQRNAREGKRGAVAAGRNLIQANGVPKTGKEWAGLQALLEDKSEISPTEARYAIAKLKKRYVGMEATPAGR